jgi:glycosyltransferase involved in cell wall biosynthesis
MPFINCTGKDWKIAVHDVEEFCSSLDVPQITGTPKVSIIIPCFNSGRFLLDAIESCAHQSYRDFEIIVVNDGSEDPLTLQVLNVLSNTGVIVIHSSNQGVSAARNLGIRKAAGEFILPLDADDRLSGNFLEKTVPVIEGRLDVGVVFGQVHLFGEISGIWNQPDFSVKRLLLDNMIVVSALFRKDDCLRIGGYRSSMVYGWEDWDFWLSMAERGFRFVKVPQSLFYYRTRSGSRDSEMKFKHKLLMYLSLILNHKKLYIRHPSVFIRLLMRLFDRNFEKAICS